MGLRPGQAQTHQTDHGPRVCWFEKTAVFWLHLALQPRTGWGAPVWKSAVCKAGDVQGRVTGMAMEIWLMRGHWKSRVCFSCHNRG